MIQRLQTSYEKKDKGFTLVELLVVIVIIGILAGIAIPLFLNQRKKGVDAGVQSDLKSLATIQETYYVDAQKYTTNPTELSTAGWNPTEGNTVGVFAPTTGDNAGKYCIQGFNAKGTAKDAGTAYYYASDQGGLKTTKPTTGVCSGTPTFSPVTTGTAAP